MATYYSTAKLEIAPDTDRLANREINPCTISIEGYVTARNTTKAEEEFQYQFHEQHGHTYPDHEFMITTSNKVNARSVDQDINQVIVR